MGKKRVMLPAEELDLSAVKYEPEFINAPHLTGLMFRLFVKILEASLIGPAIISNMKKKSGMVEASTVIPEPPMYKPEYPPQDPEPITIILYEDGKPEDRVELALRCLPEYDPANSWNGDLSQFHYWKIRDYAYGYRSKLVTPSMVAERIITVIEEFSHKKPPAPLLISFDAEEPLSILDGIFMAIKDDIGCHPYIMKGATTWMDETNSNNKDAVCVSRLRSCGVILVGKANMHELGMGTTGNNPNYGTSRNPHAPERYTGGSSSGPAAIVASGICSAALGTDGGGCTSVLLSLCDSGTLEIIGPIASSVEDVTLVYAAILGSCPIDKNTLKPVITALLAKFSSLESLNAIGSLCLGKYTPWFNDVHSTDISDKCEDILNQLSKIHCCEIVIPAHLVSVGSKMLTALNPDCEDGKGTELNYDSRTNMALFRSFTASDYVAAQCLRRRMMYHHMEIFKKVDVIVTPTTGDNSHVVYVHTLSVSGSLMRFVVAANLLGLPAISVPIGYDKQGLPIGLQLMGRPWGEASILRLASVVEEPCGSKKRPVSFYDVLKTS
ncbi:hypothetical protein ACJRO7_036046 [Eucalyptus globulus]|uniref:Amidase domain-containing protein n=1 Tax=Eucalyptus globulus TaxID=34317 RepID=A0ABD3JDQ1_EUCGL